MLIYVLGFASWDKSGQKTAERTSDGQEKKIAFCLNAIRSSSFNLMKSHISPQHDHWRLTAYKDGFI